MKTLIMIAVSLVSFNLGDWNPASSLRGPASESRQPQSGMHTCRIVTGYGTAIGKGSTHLAAKEKAREVCGTAMIDDYLARRGNISADVVDDLALACVNLECQN